MNLKIHPLKNHILNRINNFVTCIQYQNMRSSEQEKEVDIKKKAEANKYTNSSCLLSYTHTICWWCGGGRFFKANNEKSIEPMDKCFRYNFLLSHSNLLALFAIDAIRSRKPNIQTNGPISHMNVSRFAFYCVLFRIISFGLLYWLCGFVDWGLSSSFTMNINRKYGKNIIILWFKHRQVTMKIPVKYIQYT